MLLGAIAAYLLILLNSEFSRRVETEYGGSGGAPLALRVAVNTLVAGPSPSDASASGASAVGSEFVVNGELHGDVLNQVDAEGASRVEAIKLLIGTYGVPSLHLKEGSLSFPDTSCKFVSGPQSLADNTYLVLKRVGSCASVNGDGRLFNIRLRFEDSVPAIAFWANAVAPQPGFLLEASGTRTMARFVTVQSERESESRLSLLLHMWRGAADQVRVMLWGALLLLLLPALAALAPTRSARKLGPLLLSACAITSIFVGVALLYAALTPPYNGPDEPDHFLSLATLSGDPDFARHALDLAAVGHFRAIKQKSGVFSSARMKEKLAGEWVEPGEEGISDSLMEHRSPVTYAAWSVIRGLLDRQSPEHQLLNLRTLNIAITGSTFFVLALACAMSGLGGGALPPLMLLLAPALPFFCMHVSNYPLLAAAHLITGAGLVFIGGAGGRGASGANVVPEGPAGLDIWWRTVRVLIGAALVGVGVITAIAASRIGIALLIPASILMAVLLGRELGARPTLKRSCWLFVGALFALGISMTPLLAAERGMWISAASGYLGNYSTALPAPLGAWVGEHVQVAIILVTLLGVGVGAIVTSGMLYLLRDLLRARNVPPWLIWGMRGGVLGIFFISYAPLNWPLPDIERQVDFDVWRYIYLCIRTFVKDMGFAAPDFYITMSFWAGFGWLDVPMPAWFVGGVSAVPLVIITVAIFSRGRIEAKSLVNIGAAKFALLAYLAVLAYLSFQVPVNLHGRYLLGFYILYLLQVGLVLQWLCRSRTPAFRAGVLRAGIAAAFLFHGFSAAHILMRYFG